MWNASASDASSAALNSHAPVQTSDLDISVERSEFKAKDSCEHADYVEGDSDEMVGRGGRPPNIDTSSPVHRNNSVGEFRGEDQAIRNSVLNALVQLITHSFSYLVRHTLSNIGACI